MGVMEGILAGAITGITYSIFAGQPLNIIGATGPMLVYEKILYHFCEDRGLEFLPFRLWIGIWTTLLLLIIVAFDLSFMIKYITRFTEESFATLISLIFVYEAIRQLVDVGNMYRVNTNPRDFTHDLCSCAAGNSTMLNDTVFDSGAYYLSETNMSRVQLKEECTRRDWSLEGQGCDYVPDVFPVSVLIFFGTFIISYGLKMFRSSPYFPSKVREIVSDFNVIIGIISMVLVDALVGLDTPKLHVPHDFKPTSPNRGWLVYPFNGNPWWTSLAGLPPALLATILIFMDQQITSVIINRNENKLKKGVGYHLDMFIVSLQILVCSILGLPWFVASTVIAVSHVMSLRKESESSAPGEKPQFLGVRENRVTYLVVSLLTGVSIYLTVLFKHIPMPVLYGVFLYMGIASLDGLQFVQRIKLLFMPAKHQPDYSYLRHVKTYRVHMFTLIQLACFISLWVVKITKSVSIAFPLLVAALCFFRKGFECIFSQRELRELDDALPEFKRREKEDKKKNKEKRVSVTIDYNGSVPVEVRLEDHDNDNNNEFKT